MPETTTEAPVKAEAQLQGLEPDKLRQIMRDMLLARRFEEKAAEA